MGVHDGVTFSALSKVLLAAAIVLGAYTVAEHFSSERRAARRATAGSNATETDSAQPVSATQGRAIAADGAKDAAVVRPVAPAAPVADPKPDASLTADAQASDRTLGPCAADVRIAGAAYAGSNAPPMVMFSGGDVRFRGVRSVGGRVADRTVVAIYPTSVVLRDGHGKDCFVRMAGPRAREIAEAERRARDRRSIAKAREEKEEKRAAARKKKTARKKAKAKAKAKSKSAR